jgi:hypothetical protein
MAIANAYGMLLIISFLGFGLVDVPRNLWIYSNPRKRLAHLEHEVPKVKDEMDDAIGDYSDSIHEVEQLSRKQIPAPLKPFVDKLVHLVNPYSVPLLPDIRTRATQNLCSA